VTYTATPTPSLVWKSSQALGADEAPRAEALIKRVLLHALTKVEPKSDGSAEAKDLLVNKESLLGETDAKLLLDKYTRVETGRKKEERPTPVTPSFVYVQVPVCYEVCGHGPRCCRRSRTVWGCEWVAVPVCPPAPRCATPHGVAVA